MALENLIDITDPEKKGWLRDFNSFSKAPKYAFGSSDAGIERFRFVEKTNDDRLKMKDANLSGAIVEVLVGPLRAEVTLGSFDFSIDGDDTSTTDLSPAITAASLESNLNSNPGLTAYGQVAVVKYGGAFQITFLSNGAVPNPVINSEELSPGGSLGIITTIQQGSASQPHVWWLRFVQEPYAYNATWTNYSTGNAVITTEQEGSSSKYEVQRIKLEPDPWDGSITVNLSTFEKFKIQCTTNASGEVEGKGFITADENGSVGVWYNGGGDTVPADVNACDRVIEITTVTGGENATQVATKTATALAADAAFTATSSSKTVTVTNETGGSRTDVFDSSDEPTGFTFTTTQQGTFTTGTIPIDASPRDFAAALGNKVTVTKGPNPFSWDLTYKQLGNQPPVTVETQATFPNGFEGVLNFRRPSTFQAVETAIAAGLTELTAFCQIMITETGVGSKIVYRDTHPVLFSVLSEGAGGWVPPIIAGAFAGKTLWVDSETGIDNTAVRGVIGRPFLTLSAAKAAASSGDVIVVLPGTYNERNLLKNGVHWNFLPGSHITYTGTVNGGIFSDGSDGANGAVVCTINAPDSVFTHSGNPSGGASANATISVSNASSEIHVRCRALKCTSEDSPSNSGIHISNGTLVVELSEDVYSEHYDAVIQTGGVLRLKAHTAEGSPNPGSPGEGIEISGGTMELDLQRCTTGSGAGIYVIGGTVKGRIGEIIDDTDGAILVDDGTIDLDVGLVTGRVFIGGGTTRLRARIDATAFASGNPITKSGGVLVLNAGTILIAEATRNAIEAPSAQAVIVCSGVVANRPMDADISQAGGTILVDSDFI